MLAQFFHMLWSLVCVLYDHKLVQWLKHRGINAVQYWGVQYEDCAVKPTRGVSGFIQPGSHFIFITAHLWSDRWSQIMEMREDFHQFIYPLHLPVIKSRVTVFFWSVFPIVVWSSDDDEILRTPETSHLTSLKVLSMFNCWTADVCCDMLLLLGTDVWESTLKGTTPLPLQKSYWPGCCPEILNVVLKFTENYSVSWFFCRCP